MTSFLFRGGGGLSLDDAGGRVGVKNGDFCLTSFVNDPLLHKAHFSCSLEGLEIT